MVTTFDHSRNTGTLSTVVSVEGEVSNSKFPQSPNGERRVDRWLESRTGPFPNSIAHHLSTYSPTYLFTYILTDGSGKVPRGRQPSSCIQVTEVQGRQSEGRGVRHQPQWVNGVGSSVRCQG